MFIWKARGKYCSYNWKVNIGSQSIAHMLVSIYGVPSRVLTSNLLSLYAQWAYLISAPHRQNYLDKLDKLYADKLRHSNLPAFDRILQLFRPIPAIHPAFIHCCVIMFNECCIKVNKPLKNSTVVVPLILITHSSRCPIFRSIHVIVSRAVNVYPF